MKCLKLGILSALIGAAIGCQKSNPPQSPPPVTGACVNGNFGGPNGPYNGGPNGPYTSGPNGQYTSGPNGTNSNCSGSNGQNNQGQQPPYNQGQNYPNYNQGQGQNYPPYNQGQPPPNNNQGQNFDGRNLGTIPMLPMQPIQDDDGFDPFADLDNQGQWIPLAGANYFRPSILNNDPSWQPYQQGYWVYDIKFSWTWVSNDPWGSITDHYGLWRHHQQYGWVWLPFSDRKYRPHTVTWFDDDDYVGWYPYYPKYKNGYRHGYKDGFDDGYDEGFKKAKKQNKTYLGVNLVKKQDVTDINVYAKIRKNSRNEALIERVMTKSHTPERIKNGLVGPIPGGNREQAYGFLSEKAKNEPLVGSAKQLKLSNGQIFVVSPYDPSAKKWSKERKKKNKKNKKIQYDLPTEQQPEERQPQDQQPDERQPQDQQPEERQPETPQKNKKNKKQIVAPKAPDSEDSDFENETPAPEDE